MFTCGPTFWNSSSVIIPGPGGGGASLDGLDYAFNGEPFMVALFNITTEEPADNGEPFFVQGS